MRPVFRLPHDVTLTAASDMDLRLFVARQKYNVRAKRLAEKELRRRMMAPIATSAPRPAGETAPIQSRKADRPKGSLADIAWLGVMLGAGALALHVIGWWARL
jgi:hypothetical protein